jgi:hypothetical protein
MLASASRLGRRRFDESVALVVAIKVVHTAWFGVVSTSILYVFLGGLRNRPGRWTGLALASAVAESAIFVANAGRCPVTELTERVGAESGRVTDIFLPRWFADRIPYIYTPPLVIGVLLLGWHRLRAKPVRAV